MSKNDGGPAFPGFAYFTDGEKLIVASQPFGGMTLRDYFAAKALRVVWDAYDKGYAGLQHDDFDSKALAAHAYQVADAMLAERSNP